MVCTALAYRFIKCYEEDENSRSLLVYASTPADLHTNDDDDGNFLKEKLGHSEKVEEQSRFAKAWAVY